VSNVQLDDNIRIWLLEEEGFKSAQKTWKWRRRNDVFGQSIPDPRSRNEIHFMSRDRGMPLAFEAEFRNPHRLGTHPNECANVKDRHPLSTAIIGPIIRPISETVQDARQVNIHIIQSRTRAFRWYRNRRP